MLDAGWWGRIWSDFLKFSAAIVAKILAVLIGLAEKVAAFFVRTMTKADEQSNSAYGDLAKATLEHVFGVTFDRADVQGRGGDKKARRLVAKGIGDSVLKSLFAGAPSGAAGLQPSSAASEEYLQTVVHLGLEGWMESWVIDAATYHVLAKFGELKDIMAEVLGLGRLSRRVLAPPLKILVEDPYTWKLNDTYRPTLLPHDLAVRQYLRGDMTKDELDQVLGWQGFKPKDIQRLINHHTLFLNDADIDYALQRGVMDTGAVSTYFQDQGWKEGDARLKTSLLIDKRIDVYRKQMVEAAVAAFVRKDIEIDELQHIVLSSGLPDTDQRWIVKVAGMRREMQFKRLTLGEVERLIKAGIFNVDDLRDWMFRENYRVADIQAMELLLIEQVSDKARADKLKAERLAAKNRADALKAKAAAAKQALLDAQAADKGITRQQAAQLVKDGRWTFDAYSQYLAAHGAAPQAVAELTDLLHTQIDTTQAAQAKREAAKAQAAEKEVPLSQMETAVKNGVVSVSEFQDFLVKQNYGQEDIDTLVGLVKEELAAAKLKTDAKAKAADKAKQKSINLPELERAARLGLAPVASYQAALQAAGEDPTSTQLLVGILQDQIAADTGAAAKRKAAAAKAGVAGLSLAQLERAIIDGLRPMAEYSAALARLQFSQADIDSLVSLLQLRVDHAATVKEKQALAEQRAATTGLSLAEIQRATALGVLSLDQYTGFLAKFRLTADDQAILRTEMLSKLQAVGAANKKRTTSGNKLAKKGLSIAQMEAAVVAGLQTVDEFVANLVTEGLSQADAATLGELAGMKADQAKAAAAKHAIAEARAADKDPSLAKEEALVTAGIISLDDYGAYLAELGLDALEIADLQSLLADKISASQAKAAQKAAGPAPRAKKRAPVVP